MTEFETDMVRFLSRVGDGYTELSQDKIRGEYLYFKKRASELMNKHFPPAVNIDAGPLDDNF